MIGRQSLAESGDAIVDAALGAARARARRAVPARAAPRQRPRRARHGPGPGPAARPGRARRRPRRGSPGVADGAAPARARHRAASSRPPPTASIDVLVLLGADPLADFPDRDLARRALAGAGTVIAVDQFLTAARAAGRRRAAGGRLRRGRRARPPTSRAGSASLDQKVTPPGTARADWMIAAELGLRLGADLGLGRRSRRSGPRSPHVAPAYAGIDAALRRPEAGDGVVVPLAGAERRAAGDLRPQTVAGELPALDRYSLRLVASPQALRPGRARAARAVARRAGAGHRPPGQPLRPRPARRGRRASEVRLHSSRADLRVDIVVRRRGAPRHAPRSASTSPASTRPS